jgi:RNA polymerase sigma-70 factor (family 1)
MASAKEDSQLAGLIKAGNQMAFACIFDRYNKKMYLFAFRYLKNREMAEDAVQQVFVNFWINREKIREQLNIRSFLFTSIKNLILNKIRDHKREISRNYEYLMNSESELSSYENLEEYLEMTTLIERAKENLSPQRKEIFRLKIAESCTNQDIANRLNISINTVKVQYYSILKEIREYVRLNTENSALLVSFLLMNAVLSNYTC